MPRSILLSTCFGVLATSPAVSQDVAPLVDIITINASRIASAETTQLDQQDIASQTTPDTTAVLAQLPGLNSVSNGALSGQVQYRGLFGDRLNIRLNGRQFVSGGPNLMDPPMHYAPASLLEQVIVDRGISPVSAGPGLAGGMDARFKSVEWSQDNTFSLSADASIAVQSVDEGWSRSALLGTANNQFRLYAFGANETGADLSSGDFDIAGTQYERLIYGLGTGLQSDDQSLSVQFRRNETGPTGNPQFAMDIRYVDSDFIEVDYDRSQGAWTFGARLSWNDVAHAMNNFSLRPAPGDMMRFRETFAYAEHQAIALTASRDFAGGALSLGLDHTRATHDVTITNPNNADFFLNNLPDIEIERTGAFVEWQGPLGQWDAEIGARFDSHDAVADTASVGSAVPMMPAMLAVNFNLSDRAWDDVTTNFATRIWRPLSDVSLLRVNLARKTRVPSYLERFAWLPTPASAGLADGNTYVGDIELEAETAWIVEAGIDFQSDTAYFRPSAFYRRVDDYIQGVPFDDTIGVVDTPVEMVSMMNGDLTPLRFANVDAELFGFDGDFGYQLSPSWQIEGRFEYVRAKRRDISDNLYRVAPGNIGLGLTYRAEHWQAGVETVWTAGQDNVSNTNSELTSESYSLWHLHGRLDGPAGSTLAVRVDNLFDDNYVPHLGGRNRNSGGPLALGDGIAGAGRNFGLRLSWTR